MKIARDVKKQKIQPTSRKKQTTETELKMTMTVKLAHNDLKTAIINTFKDLRKRWPY